MLGLPAISDFFCRESRPQNACGKCSSAIKATEFKYLKNENTKPQEIRAQNYNWLRITTPKSESLNFHSPQNSPVLPLAPGDSR